MSNPTILNLTVTNQEKDQEKDFRKSLENLSKYRRMLYETC